MSESWGEWFSQNLWAVWAIGALLLGMAEMLTLDLTLLMLAGGALGGAITAWLFPGALVAQIIVAIVVACLMLFLLRPTLLVKVHQLPGYRSDVEKLVGSPGVVTAEITGDHGEVKVGGQEWRARAVEPSMHLPPGARIEVFEVDGITLVVYPRD